MIQHILQLHFKDGDTVLWFHIAYIFASGAMFFTIGTAINKLPASLRRAVVIAVPVIAGAVLAAVAYQLHLDVLEGHVDFVWYTMMFYSGYKLTTPKVWKYLTKERLIDGRYQPPSGWEYLYEGIDALGALIRSSLKGVVTAFTRARRSDDGTAADDSWGSTVKSWFNRITGRDPKPTPA